MRKYIYSIFLLGLFSCQEEGVVQYTQEKDGLQFSANSSEDMTKVFNFATATYEEEINGEPKTFYTGIRWQHIPLNGLCWICRGSRLPMKESIN